MFGIIHDVEWKHRRVNICLPLKIQLATGRNNLHSANVMVTVKVNFVLLRWIFSYLQTSIRWRDVWHDTSVQWKLGGKYLFTFKDPVFLLGGKKRVTRLRWYSNSSFWKSEAYYIILRSVIQNHSNGGRIFTSKFGIELEVYQLSQCRRVIISLPSM